MSEQTKQRRPPKLPPTTQSQRDEAQARAEEEQNQGDGVQQVRESLDAIREWADHAENALDEIEAER